MGGNALKNTPTERKSKEDYFRILKELEIILKPHVDELRPIEAYRNKETFGDIDILFVADKASNDITSLIEFLFNPHEIYKNGDVWSFDYDKIQVDLIKTTEEFIDINSFYYSYNDLNNLAGRTANRMGLKFGHLGLILNYKNRDVILTKDPREIYDVLGYDYDRYLKGFDDLEDIYEFVISSPYFSKEPFYNQNHSNRVRNAKRKVFIGFLEWLDGKELSDFIFEDKSIYVNSAVERFGKESELSGIDEELEEITKKNAKLNGHKLSSMFNISGETLGSFIKYVKSSSIIDFSLDDKDFDIILSDLYQQFLNKKS